MAGIEVGGAGVNVTPQNISNSDAYKFRRDQGEQAIQRRAGAAGNLLTGGTLTDLAEFNQGLASTEYGNEWQRQFGLAGLNADISGGNANRQLSGLTSLANQGYGAANQIGGLYGGYGQAGAQGTIGQNNAMNQGIGLAAGGLADYFGRQRTATQPPPPAGVLPVSNQTNQFINRPGVNLGGYTPPV